MWTSFTKKNRVFHSDTTNLNVLPTPGWGRGMCLVVVGLLPPVCSVCQQTRSDSLLRHGTQVKPPATVSRYRCRFPGVGVTSTLGFLFQIYLTSKTRDVVPVLSLPLAQGPTSPVPKWGWGMGSLDLVGLCQRGVVPPVKGDSTLTRPRMRSNGGWPYVGLNVVV